MFIHAVVALYDDAEYGGSYPIMAFAHEEVLHGMGQTLIASEPIFCVVLVVWEHKAGRVVHVYTSGKAPDGNPERWVNEVVAAASHAAETRVGRDVAPPDFIAVRRHLYDDWHVERYG